MPAIGIVHRCDSSAARLVWKQSVYPVLVNHHGPVSTSFFSGFKPNLCFVWEIPGFIFIITFSFGAALRAIWNLLKHAELWIKGFCILCQMHRNQVWGFCSNHVEVHFNSQSILYFLLRNWWVLFNAEVRIYNFRLAVFSHQSMWLQFPKHFPPNIFF